MESAINKKNAMAAMADTSGTAEIRATAGILVALIEIREAVEDGFGRIDQTNIEAALMLVGCKETLDAFLDARLKTDKVLLTIKKAVEAMHWKDKTWERVDEDKQAKPEAPVEAAAEVALAAIKAANESGVAVEATTAEIAAVVAAAKESKEPETADESAELVDEPEKPSVTLDVGDFGKPGAGSGIS